MQIFTCILLGFLLVCAISVSLSKNLLNSILIFMSYSLVMSIIWIVLESPDLAITEAAVGAGVTSILFFVTLKKIHAIMDEESGLDGTFDMEDAPEASEEPGTPEKSGISEKSETLKEPVRPEAENRAEVSRGGQKNAKGKIAGTGASNGMKKTGKKAGKGGKPNEQKTV